MELSKYLTPIRDLSKEPLERGEYLAGNHLVGKYITPQGDGSVLYNCFINRFMLPSNVLNVSPALSLRKMNEAKSKKLGELLEEYSYQTYDSVVYKEVRDFLTSIKGNLDFSFYDFDEYYEDEMFRWGGFSVRNFQNCIFSHINLCRFEFRSCDLRGSSFSNLTGYVKFYLCDLRNVVFDESMKDEFSMQHCITNSQQIYNAQKKEGFDNMLIIKGKAFNVVKDIATEDYDFSKINFEGLSFKGLYRLKGVYKHCNFTKANLSDINIIANIDFSLCIDADFSKSKFSCEVEPFDNARGTNFGDKMPKVVGVDFTNANFENAKLTNCRFIDCKFEGVNFSGAIYSDETLSRSNCIPKDAIEVMIHEDDVEDEDDWIFKEFGV